MSVSVSVMFMFLMFCYVVSSVSGLLLFCVFSGSVSVSILFCSIYVLCPFCLCLCFSDILCFVSQDNKNWVIYPEFKLCNNEPGYSTASLIESDSESVIGKCSHNICCENLKCSVQLDHDACVGEDEIFEPNNNCRSYDICKNTVRYDEKLDFC